MKDLGKQAGLTLVELLIASVLGLLLTLGVAQLFVSGSDTFRLAESIGRMQESGRLAQDILGRSVRSTDYWGCLSADRIRSVVDENHGSYDPDLHNFVDPQGIQFDIGDGTTAATGTVLIQLKGMRSVALPVDTSAGGTNGAPISGRTIPLQSLSAGQVNQGGFAMLSDCDDAIVFRVSDIDLANNTVDLAATITDSGGNAVVPGNEAAGSCSDSSLPNCFPATLAGGELFTGYVERYYIRDDNGRRSLVFDGFGPTGVINRQEIVTDVIDMQVQVGSGPRGDNVINNWQTVNAGNLTTVNDKSVAYVKAVRISLLVRSQEDGVAGSLQNVCYPAWSNCTAGNNWTPANTADRHYYRVYTSTYSIRNRLLDTSP
ncbi:PilW family protein [Marinobacter sp. NSM]|uniref:PilW family protein n=1 Tax=Marinobacter sp. NSM TaxID=3458004 RepID=UPI00403687B8